MAGIKLASDTLQYQVVYDIRNALPNAWWLPLVLLPLGIFGYALFRQHRNGASRGDFRASAFGVVVMIAGGMGTLSTFVASVFPYVLLRMSLTSGSYEVVEGVVSNFTPGDSGDHRDEMWTVLTPTTSHRFAYSPSILVAGYNQTAAHGGRVRNGMHVRVLHVSGRIVRLEVAT